MSIQGGVVDTDNGVVAVALGAADISSIIGAGIMTVDLASGDRTLLSGTLEDPAMGTITGGSGPDFPGEVMDVAIGPDGSYYTLSASLDASSTSIVSVDPGTGARTIVAEDTPASRLCAAGGVDLRFADYQNTASSGWAGQARLAIGDDGSIYSSVSDDNAMFGIAAIVGSACTITTLVDDNGVAGVGMGPNRLANFRGIDITANTLYSSFGPDGLASIDVASGNRTLVSSVSDGVGRGGELGQDYVAVAVDGATIYTANSVDSLSAELVAVDAVAGDRTELNPIGGPLLAREAIAVMVHPTDPDLLVFIQPLSVGLYEIPTGNSVLLSY